MCAKIFLPRSPPCAIRCMKTCLYIVLFSSANFANYDRCDDLCRVLGHERGSCITTAGETRCQCVPDDINVDEILPGICGNTE